MCLHSSRLGPLFLLFPTAGLKMFYVGVFLQELDADGSGKLTREDFEKDDLLRALNNMPSGGDDEKTISKRPNPSAGIDPSQSPL